MSFEVGVFSSHLFVVLKLKGERESKLGKAVRTEESSRGKASERRVQGCLPKQRNAWEAIPIRKDPCTNMGLMGEDADEDEEDRERKTTRGQKTPNPACCLA